MGTEGSVGPPQMRRDAAFQKASPSFFCIYSIFYYYFQQNIKIKKKERERERGDEVEWVPPPPKIGGREY